jgi:hypothetical protein
MTSDIDDCKITPDADLDDHEPHDDDDDDDVAGVLEKPGLAPSPRSPPPTPTPYLGTCCAEETPRGAS